MLAALLAPVTRRLVYPSRATRVPAEGTTFSMSVPGAELRGWQVNPGRPDALVYFGGNGEDIGPRRHELAHRFADHTCYLVAYRGYGASSGRPGERALTRDAVALHDLVAARHLGGAVDVVGRSLGSGVAMQLAARRPVRRLVLVTPFDSMVANAADLFPRLPARHLVHDRWDSAGVAESVRARVLVLRAGRDTLVLPARTDALVSALPPETRVTDFPHADHATIVEEPTYWTEIEAFLRR
ncbi:MAG TPA: alpha/beta fold hydrolase [Nocardioides sp.]|nr:alpha/beta fold hydrolase [Nocardioides sp.]